MVGEVNTIRKEENKMMILKLLFNLDLLKVKINKQPNYKINKNYL